MSALTAILVSGVLGLAIAVPATAAPRRAADLRADSDRDGRVSIRAAARDDRGEQRWRRSQGAIVLANVDDDGRRCGFAPTSPLPDEELAACNDAADASVNGPGDLRDMARLRTVPWNAAPPRAMGTVELLGHAPRGRLFIRRGGRWLPAGRTARLDASELRRGSTLALEATDIVRERRAWDGRLRVRLTVRTGRRRASDTVELRVAPLIVQPEILEPKQVLTSPAADYDRITWVERARAAVRGAPLGPGSRASWERAMEKMSGSLLWRFEGLAAEQQASQQLFQSELIRALGSVGLALRRIDTQDDVWTQDIFEPAFASMPGPDGRPQVMQVLVRSANAMRNGTELAQRGGGRAVFTQLRGPDVGAVQQLTPGRALLPIVGVGEDTVNSAGNFSATPSYETATRRFPNGRLIYGSAPGSRPDAAFVRMLVDQAAQPPIELDTSWLEVGHIDEFLAILPADNARGWVVVVADPRYAYRLLREAANSQVQPPTATILEGLKRVAQVGPAAVGTEPAARLAADVLADPEVKEANDRASEAIERNLALLRDELALKAEEIVRLPVLYEPLPLTLRDGVGAYIPNGVNGLYAGDRTFIAPRQYGPRVLGADLFERDIRSELGRVGIRVEFVETYYHGTGAGVGGGEVHCRTNVMRDITPIAAWWQASKRP